MTAPGAGQFPSLGIHESTLRSCHEAVHLLHYLDGYIGAASHSKDGLSQQDCKELAALIETWCDLHEPTKRRE